MRVLKMRVVKIKVVRQDGVCNWFAYTWFRV